jgi:hypothetical protein
MFELYCYLLGECSCIVIGVMISFFELKYIQNVGPMYLSAPWAAPVDRGRQLGILRVLEPSSSLS